MSSRTSYVARINGVIDHIDAHLDAPLDLQSLAAIAHFSPWHFHRLFQAFTGETLAERVRRRRLETAAVRLLGSPPATALSVALDVGFGSAEVFSRSFKGHFGVTPSAWRRGAYRTWADERRHQLSKIHQASRKPGQVLEAVFREDADERQSRRVMQAKGDEMKLEMKSFPDVRVAYMRHVGPYGDPGIGRMWQRFEAWCREKGMFKPQHEAYGISHDSPDITAPEKCRYDACIAVDAGFRPEGEIGVQTIAGGFYACAPFTGTGEEIHAAWMRVYSEWLPDSGYQADDRPCIEAYGSDLKIDPKTGAFSCELRLPVRAL
jgi:AraC family transcriptional regulator